MKTRIVSALLGTAMCVSVQAANYYVNDASTVGDVYCSAIGKSTNSGTAASAPKAAMQEILDTYALAPGDTVYVDTGSYSNTIAATIGPADDGDPVLGKVTFKGAGSTKTLLVTTNNGAYGVFFSGASYVRLEGVAIRSAGQGVRIENGGHIELSGCDLYFNSYGVVVSGGSDHKVEGCTIHHNGHQGVVVSYSPSLVISSNVIHSQTGIYGDHHGIDLSYNCNAAWITGNTITNNSSRGITIYSCASPLLQDNMVSGNGAEGVFLQSCSSGSVENHAVSLNGYGIRAYYCPAFTVTGCRVWSNTGYGVWVEGGAVTADHNLIYTNGAQGLMLVNAPQSTVENNTFHRNATVNLRLSGSHGSVRVANNILFSCGPAQTCIQFDTIGTSWSADYNDYYITNGAALWNWKGPRYSLSALQTYSGMERHSIDLNPLFLDPDGPDNILGGAGGADDSFHFATNSPTLDAGDPDSDYSAEPLPNGSRINLGCYGNTTLADTSGTVRQLRLLAPLGGEIVYRRTPVRWASAGPWSTNDLVKIEYSANNGTNWTIAASAATLNHANSLYTWDLSTITPGRQYLIRVTAVSDASVTDRSAAVFEVQGPAAKLFYLNDRSLAGDTWCTAVGSPTNSGLIASAPLDSFESLIEKYPALGAGDEIRVDTGEFDSGRTVYLNHLNCGASGSPLVFRGSTSGAAVFSRSDRLEDTFLFEGVSHVTFDRLNFILGYAGARVAGSSLHPSVGIVFNNCQSFSNSYVGILVSPCSNLVVTGCSSWRNSSDGFSLSAPNSVVSNNLAAWNTGIGLEFGGSGVVCANLCASNGDWGLAASFERNSLTVSSNVAHHNYHGIWVGGGVATNSFTRGNLSFANTYYGIIGNRCGGLDGNVVCSNGSHGISIEYASHATRNVVSDNLGHGITGWGASIVTNNLVVRNGDTAGEYNISLPWGAVIRNNTLYGSNGVYISDASSAEIANNIIWSRGSGMTALYIANPPGSMSSDYNDIHVTEGAVVGNWFGPRATLGAWQQVSLQDPNSISIDPRFVDSTTNFHLRSTSGSYRGAPFTAPGGGSLVADADVSFCIDAGDPASGYSLEPVPNGGRIDLGAFGNTPDASLSPSSRYTLLVEPLPGAKWFGIRTITWLTRGPWVVGDRVKLEFSPNGGVNWSNIVASLDYALGRYDWNTTGLPAGANYLVRISKTDGTAMNVMAGAFEISASGPRTYYVNDTNRINDVYCTAIGNAGNDGLTAATPKDSVQGILDTYVVAGGDTIKVDTGLYQSGATVVMTTNDVGQVDSPIVILGSTNGTVIDRQSTSYNTFFLQGSEYVRFQNIRFTGGYAGLAGGGTATKYLRNIEVLDCDLATNGTYGINMNYISNLVIQGCSIHHNSSRGAYFTAISQATIVSNVFSFGGEGLYVDSSGVVSGNQCYSNSSEGLRVSGNFVMAGNSCWRNSTGIRAWTHVMVTNNLCYSNTYEGIYVTSSTNEVVFNRVFRNGRTGIYFEGSGRVHRNVVYSNGDHGINFEGYEGDYREIVNNLCYLNGNAAGEYNIIGGANYWQGKRGLVENNTCYGGGGIYIGNPIAFTNRHNIIWTSGSNNVALVRYTHLDRYAWGVLASDYNCIKTTNGAIVGQWYGNQTELADWQYAADMDHHSFVADPLFVNPPGPDGIMGGTNGWDDNFHLASTAGSYSGAPFTATAGSTFTTNAQTSPCVDACMASAGVRDEVEPNGLRRNLGAFGGTFDASLSPNDMSIALLGIAEGDCIRGTRTISWITRGPWAADETLRFEYSANGGASWDIAPGLGAVPVNQASVGWDASSLASGTNYALRVTGNTNGMCDTIMPVRIIANGPTDFYVNDSSRSNDVYCTAIGNESNSGLAPSAPKATLKRLFCDYQLIAGDRVWIDTGWWALDSTMQFLDSGSVAAKIRFIGSTNATGSWFDRVDNQQNAFLISCSDHVSLENLKVTRSYDAIHIEGSGSDLCDGVQVLGCELSTNSHYSVYFTSVTNLTIASCDMHDNTYSCIYGGGSGVIRSNRTSRTDYYEAIRVWGGPLLVEGNLVFQNDNIGIRGTTLVTCQGNTVFSNAYEGCYFEGSGCEVYDNRVFLNGRSGIYFGGSGSLRRNIIYSNKDHGIAIDGYAGDFRVVANNLCYTNGETADEYNIYLSANSWQGKQGVVEGNTVYGGGGIYIGNPTSFTNRNNIIWATGAGRHAIVRYTHMDNFPSGILESDYNCIIATDGAIFGDWMGNQNDLLEWRKATGMDAHSFSVNPIFVNPSGADGVMGGANGLDDNFHLMSTVGSFKGRAFTAVTTAGFTADATNSPCVDAALPATAIGGELLPNGGRVNLGAFGGTADASLSTGTRVVEIGIIAGGSVLRGTVPVRWWTHGAWTSGDTVFIEYSSNGGGSWSAIPGATALPFADGVFAWNTSALTPGANYKVRITPTAGGTPSVSGLLRVLPNAATVFYVNDGSTANDVYCTAVGSDGNDGLTPATPMAGVKRLISTYTLIADDTVRIDTGLWTLDANVVLTDCGASGQPIRLVGSTNSAGSVFNRNDTTASRYAFHLKTNHFMRVENLKVTGAYFGIYAEGPSSGYSQGIEMVACDADANYEWGLIAGRTTNLVINACLARNNHNGIDADTGAGTISGNTVHNNNYTGIYLNGSFVAAGNDCHHNGSHAIRGISGVLATNNVVHENTGEPALYLYGTGCEAVGNRVYLNSGDGMNVNFGGITRRNVIFSNGGHGLVVDSWYGANTVVNNLVYDNDRLNQGHWNVYVNRNGDTIQNNTIYGANGLCFEGPWGDVARNNIIQAAGAGRYAIYFNNNSALPVSDYNNLYVTDGATLGYWGGARADFAAWKSASGLDSNSISANPLFVDANGADETLGGFNSSDDDFHLSSTAGSYHAGFWYADATNSPCIDAGHPSIMFTNEPYYNGLRANQGAYGNTVEASKTAYAGVFYKLNIAINPVNGGSVVAWPPGVSNLFYPANASVSLTESNNLLFIWGNWSGAVSGTNTTVSLNVTSNTAVTANFIPMMDHVLYQFEDNLRSSINTPPDLTNINSGQTFSTATVRGAARRVLNFPYNTGLQLQPTYGVFPNQLYTMVILFRFDTVAGWNRLLDFRNGIEQGLYVHDGMLEFYGYSGASAVCLTNNTWHMVAITHDVTGEMKLYCDGVLRLTLSDSSNYGVVSSANTMRFFKDNGGENTSGSVSRLHIYSRILDATEIASLNSLDDAPPLITSAQLTGAAQGVPFLWPVTGPGVARYSATGLPSGLAIGSTNGQITGSASVPGVFDVLIRATNNYGAVTQSLRVLVTSSTNLLFREDFNNGFSANWNAMSVDSNYFAFLPAMMDLRANNGETYGSTLRPVNLFAFSNAYSGDMMITIGVNHYEPTTAYYNRLCLVSWDDYDNNVRAAYGFNAVRQIEILGEQAQTMTGATATMDLTNRPFLLRLVKQGGGASDRYTAYYSTNGVDFVGFTNNSVINGNGLPAKLGFWMGIDPNENSHSYIDFFEVVAVPQTNPPQTYTDNFAAGNGAASWRFQNKAGIYTFDQSQGCLSVSKPTGGSGASTEWGTASSAVTLYGDFDVSVDYRDAVLTRLGGGWGNQIQLNCAMTNQFVAAIRGNEGGLGGDVAHVWFDPPAGNYGITATALTNGTLRLIRSGSIIKAFHNSTFLAQRDCNTNPATLSLSLQNNGTTDPISVKFDNFRASARQVALVPPVFTSAALTAGMINSPFVWQVTADYWSGLFAAGLPPGLSMNATGLITGTVTASGAFNATITATNAQTSFAQPLRIVVSDGVGVLWREDFNNGLSAPWTTVPTNTSYHSFQAGLMKLRANNGDTWTSYNRDLNLFAVNTPTVGDFMMTMGIARFTPDYRDSPGIFLVGWDDTDNNVRYGYYGGSSSRATQMAVEWHQGMTTSASTNLDRGTNAFVMRLVKQGNLYSFWASTNGTDFATIATIPAAAFTNFVPRQLGFWMGLDSYLTNTMLIDYVEIAALTMTNAGVRPVFATAKLTGGLLGSPFLWEVNADYATGYSATGLPPGLGLAPLTGRITGTPITAGVYDSIITATNVFGSTTQTLRIVVRGTGGVLFRDDFNSGPGTGWTSLPTNYVTALPGIGRVRANNGNTSGSTLPVPFTVARPTNGVYSITLGLTQFVPGPWNSPSIWVMSWLDFDHNVCFGSYGSAGGPRAQLCMENGSGSYVYTDYPTNFGSGPFLIRMNVSNTVYTTAFSTNGVDFIKLPGTNTVTAFTPTQVGFWAGIDPYQDQIALVDYYEVSTTAPTNPVTLYLAGYGLTGANADFSADPDHDNLKNVFEYAFNCVPTNAASVTFPVGSQENDHLIITYRERAGGTGTVGVDYMAGGLLYIVQVADDLLGSWDSGSDLVELVPGSRINNGDGTETVSVRIKQSLSGTTQKFIRLILIPTS